MIAVDTNVIVRFLVRDDETQAEAAYRRFRKAEDDREPLLVPLLVVLETVWVLGSAYGKSRVEIVDSIEDMRRMPVLRFERDDVLQRALLDGRDSRADLADLLIAHSAQASDCDCVITFDREAARLPFFRLLR
jgi:predicted nucleic-acid-binding protein